MVINWKHTTIGEIADASSYGLVDGPFGSNLPAACYTSFGVPVIRGSNLSLGESRFKGNEFVYVSAETADRLNRSCCKPNDIIFTKKGTLGQTGLVPERGIHERYLLSSNQMKLTVDTSKADPLFVYYYVTAATSRAKILKDSEATGVPKINLAYLKSFPLLIPSVAEQKSIASVLGALDDKIELNGLMNATLESMAHAMFQSWFVDFDPVRAKLDGCPNASINKATAHLFPAAFQESAVGHVPQGWKVGVFNDLTKSVIGGDWGASEPTGDDNVSCFCIRGADIPSLQSGGVGKMPTRFLKQSSVEKRQLADGDLAIEISGGSPTQCTGRPVLASDLLLQDLGQPLVASNFCRIVKLKSPAFSKFVYFWLRRLYDIGELFQFETGTTGIKNFAFVIFSEKYPLVIPDERIAEAFDRAVSPLFARIQANSQESRTLVNLRDALLPKLMNGELSRVKSTTT